MEIDDGVFEADLVHVEEAASVDEDGAAQETSRVVMETTRGQGHGALLDANGSPFADESDDSLTAIGIHVDLVLIYLKQNQSHTI